MTTFEEARRIVSDSPVPPRFKGDRTKWFVAIRGDLELQEYYRVCVKFKEMCHRKKIDPWFRCS